LTFHQVKYYAEDKFGRNGFKVIEEERTQILRKEFKRAQLKMITEYFKFPKIILGILLAFLAFKASFYFDEPVNFVAKLFGLLVILGIPALFSFFTNRKFKGKRFLELNISHSTFTGIFGLMYWVMYLLNSFKESVQSHPILILAFCCLWVVGILFLITGIHLQKNTIENVKRQYQLI
jgi:predicted neutral ceramidase superfamily lipid hydrolase